MNVENVCPQEVGRLMLANDLASQTLGIQLVTIDSGAAVLTMLVRADMVNGLGICHGGLIFSLADTAFAFACNSRNRKTVALTCSINFVAAAHVDDTLTATAMEITLNGRTGVYDVFVRNQHTELVATFRGTSYGTSSAVVAEFK